MEAGPPPPAEPARFSLAQRIRTAREQRGQSPADVAGPEFSAAYIAAVERSAVRPSPLVLEYLAGRLDLPLGELQLAPCELATTVDLRAVAEDLRYQAHWALRLIRNGDADGGLQLIAAAEAHAGADLAALPVSSRYLIPFLRGRAYYQRAEFARAQRALEQARAVAESDAEATVNTCNLLGAVLYQCEHPERALQHHLVCLRLLQTSVIKDLNLRLSVYRNLANDYLALNDLAHAIEVYQQALALLADLDDPERRAGILWGLLMACRGVGNGPQAKLYGLQALQIYEDLDRAEDAAAVCLNLAEIFLDEQRPPAAEQLLKKAKWFLRQSTNPGLKSYLYGDWATLALQEGHLEQATQYAAESIRLAAANRRLAQDAATQRGEYPTRTYAGALHIAGLVEEAKGNPAAADRLFATALEQISGTAFDEAAQEIRLRYADVLSARGAFAQSVEYYALLASFRPRSRQGPSV